MPIITYWKDGVKEAVSIVGYQSCHIKEYYLVILCEEFIYVGLQESYPY